MSLLPTQIIILALIGSAGVALLLYSLLNWRRSLYWKSDSAQSRRERFDQYPLFASATVFLFAFVGSLLIAYWSLSDTPAPDPTAQMRQLENRVVRLESRPPDSNATAPAPDLAVQIGQLENRVVRLESRSPDSHATQSQTGDLADAVGNLSTSISNIQPATGRDRSRADARRTWAMRGLAIMIVLAAIWLGMEIYRKQNLGLPTLLIGTLSLGFTVVAVDADSIFTIHLGGAEPPIVASGTPTILVSPANMNSGFRPAYAVPFAEGSDAIGPPIGTAIADLVHALGPCVQRPGEGRPLILTVTGFASSTPFVGQRRAGSNQSNVDLAEQRSQSVAERLSQGLCHRPRCDDERTVVVRTGPSGRTYNLMMGGHLFGDASTGNDRRRAVEFLTRTALVTVDNPGRCLSQQSGD